MDYAKNKLNRRVTAYVVRVAFMAAMLSAFKFALSFVPNVEIVTLMICVYGSAMGIAYALPAALVFCTVEIALYGFGSWVLLYYVYWCLLAAVAGCVLKGKRIWLAVVIGTIGSALFGVLSACCDTLFCAASLAPARLGDYWIAYYIRGLYFDVVHIISNAVILSVLYAPLVAVTRRVAPTVCAKVRAPKNMRRYVLLEYARESCDGKDLSDIAEGLITP